MAPKKWNASRERIMKVKSPSEIYATLDQDGKLDGLPFMPEMVAYCGACIRVYRSAHRTCVVGHGFRAMKNAVFLQDARCDGSYHDRCQRGCMFFWKNDWLTPAEGTSDTRAAWSAQDIAAAEKLRRLPTRDGERYVCQSTELKSATQALHRWDIRPFIHELWIREISLSDFVRIVIGTLLRRAGIRSKNHVKGEAGKKSRGSLDLRPNEWVRIKPIEELRQNLDEKGWNCGLAFPPTMHHAIGQRHQVAFPVRQIIIEQTGMMVKLSNTVALHGLLCEGVHVANCPRAEYLYCRESWLNRSPAPVSDAPRPQHDVEPIDLRRRNKA
jgi:hypothetical protein